MAVLFWTIYSKELIKDVVVFAKTEHKAERLNDMRDQITDYIDTALVRIREKSI
jgi:predicted small metal-binding protein